jgi:hypothetical protein
MDDNREKNGCYIGITEREAAIILEGLSKPDYKERL